MMMLAIGISPYPLVGERRSASPVLIVAVVRLHGPAATQCSLSRRFSVVRIHDPEAVRIGDCQPTVRPRVLSFHGVIIRAVKTVHVSIVDMANLAHRLVLSGRISDLLAGDIAKTEIVKSASRAARRPADIQTALR